MSDKVRPIDIDELDSAELNQTQEGIILIRTTDKEGNEGSQYWGTFKRRLLKTIASEVMGLGCDHRQYAGGPRCADPRCPNYVFKDSLSSIFQGTGQLTRPDWDGYFSIIAEAVSLRADCRRAKHGCVIVDQSHRIISTGYNGSPPEGPSCLAGECPRGLKSFEETPSYLEGNHNFSDCVAVHAEANAILRADWADLEGATLYITGPNCDMCSKLIAASPIKRVVITRPQSSDEGPS
jgi:dCMP deaminase